VDLFSKKNGYYFPFSVFFPSILITDAPDTTGDNPGLSINQMNMAWKNSATNTALHPIGQAGGITAATDPISSPFVPITGTVSLEIFIMAICI